jgi:glyoxylase-like metal-dependent hydrolase (beta-lactamase superfamily II)
VSPARSEFWIFDFGLKPACSIAKIAVLPLTLMLDSHWKIDVLLTGNWRGAASVLLSSDSERVLVDTGLPHDAHQVVSALEKRGLATSDITCIINTHFHIDHVSNNCLFPQVPIFTTQESFEWCLALYSDIGRCGDWERLVLKYYPETLEYPNARQLMEKIRKIGLRWWDAKRIGSRSQFRWIETHGMPGGMNLLLTSGHVPGHASLILRNERELAVVAGDALLTRNHDYQVLTMIPHCRAQYEKDRERILRMDGLIIPGHDRAFVNTASS